MSNEVWVSGDVTLYLADCLDMLPTLEAGSVDVVVTDPPYGIGFKSHGAKVPRYDVIRGDRDFDIAVYFPELLRVTKDSGAIYLYARWDIAHLWHEIVQPDAQIIIPRGRVSMGNLSDYADDYEVVLFKRVGSHSIDASSLRIVNNSHAKNPPLYKVRIGSLWGELVSNEAWERAQHPTQKTVATFSKMIQVSTNSGFTVLDPFMGVGTTGVACVKTNRKFIGIEIDRCYYEIAKKRIREAQMQPRLFQDNPSPTLRQTTFLQEHA